MIWEGNPVANRRFFNVFDLCGVASQSPLFFCLKSGTPIHLESWRMDTVLKDWLHTHRQRNKQRWHCGEILRDIWSMGYQWVSSCLTSQKTGVARGVAWYCEGYRY